jgi:uncharacterized membrane protein YdcZ (DUF606 family)
LQRILREGAHASGVRGVLPTVTYPSHTTIVTGIWPARHGIYSTGLMRACLVFGIAWLIPRVGAGAVMITLIAGQVMGGMVMSHFGWLGSPVKSVSPVNLPGALVMSVGVVMTNWSK